MAFWLKENGFGKVYALEGGWHAWRAAGYPVEGKNGDPSGGGPAP